jgi:hypothetical protein
MMADATTHWLRQIEIMIEWYCLQRVVQVLAITRDLDADGNNEHGIPDDEAMTD